ncbi:hypothetical protein SO802_034302 [Lithocarpus litseifolius]|uniref:Transmembrane protein n=1 Tax=Lithocarpus litseifolius TaxID=425828 RepID=A0AAW2BG91_9ROSI
MHRSSSTSQVSSELFSSQSQSKSRTSSSSSDNDQQQEQELLLPTYDPLSHVAKKQLSRLRSAQSAVHLIPLVLLLCAIILWFFSTPGIYSFLTHPSALLYFSIYSLSIFFFYIALIGCWVMSFEVEVLKIDNNVMVRSTSSQTWSLTSTAQLNKFYMTSPQHYLTRVLSLCNSRCASSYYNFHFYRKTTAQLHYYAEKSSHLFGVMACMCCSSLKEQQFAQMRLECIIGSCLIGIELMA